MASWLVSSLIRPHKWRVCSQKRILTPFRNNILLSLRRPFSSQSDATSSSDLSLRSGTWPKNLAKSNILVTDPNANRWLHGFLPAALLHIPIGGVYAWSMWSAPMTLALGVVAPAFSDWSMKDIAPVFSVTALSFGVTTFFLGPWQERAGPRMVASIAGLSYSSALALTGLGVYLHHMPLLYAGYGVLGGIAWGLGYLSPVSTMMRWFPERKGFAAGLTLTAFGAGAALAAPAIQKLTEYFYVIPTYVGTLNSVKIVEGAVKGKHYAEFNGDIVEVVVAAAKDVASMPDIHEGVYIVGSGSTGAAQTFGCLSVPCLL